MWNTPTKAQLEELPRLCETDEVPAEDKIVFLHFWIGGCDWYAVEYDGNDRFFGYAILHNNYDNAEWGYFSLRELQSIRVDPGIEVDRDLYWEVLPAGQVDQIRINLLRPLKTATQGRLNS